MHDDNLCTMKDETNNNCPLHSEENILHPQIMASVSWAKLNEHDKNTIISVFEMRVFEKVDVDMSLCENSWMPEHVLSEN